MRVSHWWGQSMLSLDLVDRNDARERRLKIDGCLHEQRLLQGLRFGGKR